MEQHDVVIVGAGPGGAATSMFLSKEKIPHLIIDKATFPRDKVCGDALSGKVISILNKYDKSIVMGMESNPEDYIPSYGVTFVAPNGHGLDIPFSSDFSKLAHAPGYISKREVFDNFLFEKLDSKMADIRTGTEITDIRRNGEGVELDIGSNGSTQTIKAKIIIGAEGDRSIVAKKLSQVRKENKHYCAGIRAYYDGVTGIHKDNFIELHFVKRGLPGYFWIFPLPNGKANVGMGMLSEAVSAKKVNVKQLMLDIIENDPAISPRFKNAKLEGDILGWGLPLGSKKRRISGDNFMLIGDAASLIDPFTGEGIGNAMLSGMLAANRIKVALASQKFDSQTMLVYDNELYAQIGKELKLSTTLQRLVRFPWLFNFVVDKARKNKALQETFMAMFEDLDIRDKLKDPKFYFKMLFN